MAEQSDGRANRTFTTNDIVALMKSTPGKVYSREELAVRYGVDKSRITANIGAWVKRNPRGGIDVVTTGSAWGHNVSIGAFADHKALEHTGPNFRRTEEPDLAAQERTDAAAAERRAAVPSRARAKVTQRSRGRTGPTRFTWVADVASGGFLIRGNDGTLYMARVLKVD